MKNLEQLIDFALRYKTEKNVYVKGNKFTLKNTEKEYVLEAVKPPLDQQKITKKYETIEICDDITVYGKDALLLRTPLSKYEFINISTSNSNNLYNVAVFKVNNKEHKDFYFGSFFNEENNCNITINQIIISGERYICLKIENKIQFTKLIGLTLRYRHAIAFLNRGISSNTFVALTNDDNDFFVSYAASFSANHSFSIFTKPHEYDYCGYENTKINSQFANHFISKTINDSHIYSVLLLLSERAQYNIYASTAVSFVSLEILANKFKFNGKLSNTIKAEIDTVSCEFNDTLNFMLKECKISNDTYSHIKNKLISLKQPTNKFSLESVFHENNIKLDEKDQNIFKLRNKYLHGRISSEDGNEMNDFMVYLNTSRLVSCLLLKLCEYSGQICKYDRFINANPRPLFEDVFTHI